MKKKHRKKICKHLKGFMQKIEYKQNNAWFIEDKVVSKDIITAVSTIENICSTIGWGITVRSVYKNENDVFFDFTLYEELFNDENDSVDQRENIEYAIGVMIGTFSSIENVDCYYINNNITREIKCSDLRKCNDHNLMGYLTFNINEEDIAIDTLCIPVKDLHTAYKLDLNVVFNRDKTHGLSRLFNILYTFKKKGYFTENTMIREFIQALQMNYDIEKTYLLRNSCEISDSIKYSDKAYCEIIMDDEVNSLIKDYLEENYKYHKPELISQHIKNVEINELEDNGWHLKAEIINRDYDQIVDMVNTIKEAGNILETSYTIN
jgi:hypothetical protein